MYFGISCPWSRDLILVTTLGLAYDGQPKSTSNHGGGGRDHVSGGRDHVSGGWDHVSGGRDHVSGGRDHVSGGRDHAIKQIQ